MRELPESRVYEQEFKFMPWGVLMDRVLSIIGKKTPGNGDVLDLMCGPGYLLGEIAKRRPDLALEGVDLREEFIQHARRKYPKILFKVADVLSWAPKKKYDLVVCTGGIHHLPYDKQARFLKAIPALLKPNGFAVFADPYIDDYSNEKERKQAGAKLGYEYLVASIKSGAPDEVINAAIDILYNDVLRFEYKTSVKKLGPVFKSLFKDVKITKTWPKKSSGYGDYFVVCRN